MALNNKPKIRYKIKSRYNFKAIALLLVFPISTILLGSNRASGFALSDIGRWFSFESEQKAADALTEKGTQEPSKDSSNQYNESQTAATSAGAPALETQGPFEIPAGFEDRVAFWINIYSKYTADDAVFHDSRNLARVFRVLDLRPITQSKMHPFLKEVKVKKLIKSERAKLVAQLSSLRKKLKSMRFTPAEQELYISLGEPKKAHVISEALENLRMQLGQKSFFESALKNSDIYLPTMEKIFTDKGIPKELTRVPFVESSFNLAARSRVGASGIWQIMPATGRKLMPNDHIDYRNDPIKATEFAAGLLKFNYKVIDTWPLAVTAYNHGPTSIVKITKKYKTKDLPTLIKRAYGSHAFAFASSNFYACFLAALHVEKNKDFYFPNREKNQEIVYSTIKLKKPIKIGQLYKWFSENEGQANLFNPHLSRKVRVGNTKIPAGTILYVPFMSTDVSTTTLSDLAQMI